MVTPSLVLTHNKENNDGSLIGIYNHFDSQPEKLGIHLAKRVKTEADVLDLISEGIAESIIEGIFKGEETHYRFTDVNHLESFLEKSNCFSYVYLFDGEWKYSDVSSTHKLNWITLKENKYDEKDLLRLIIASSKLGFEIYFNNDGAIEITKDSEYYCKIEAKETPESTLNSLQDKLSEVLTVQRNSIKYMMTSYQEDLDTLKGVKDLLNV
jgi:hypothetical protein